MTTTTSSQQQQQHTSSEPLKNTDELVTLGKCPPPKLRAQMSNSVQNVCYVDVQTIHASTENAQEIQPPDNELNTKDTISQGDASSGNGDNDTIAEPSTTTSSSQSDQLSSTPQPDPTTSPDAKKEENPMKKIYLEKVVLNMGMGKSGESINIAKKALGQITQGNKPSQRHARDSQRDWGVRKGEPIGVSVTIRGEKAHELLKRLFDAKGNVVNGRSFDNFGNYSFGIREHIDIPGVKYEPQIGILGLGVSVALARPGYSIRKRSKHRASVGRTHIISSEDAKRFIVSKFGVEVEA